MAIAAAVVVVLAGVSVGLITGLGSLRGPQPVIVLTDDSSPAAASQGSSADESPANTLSGAKAELWAEIQRIRQGVASGDLIFDWPPSEAAQGDLPSDLTLLDWLEESFFIEQSFFRRDPTRSDLTLYLSDSAGDAVPLRTEISDMPGVRMLEFVSKEEALERLKDSFTDHPEILESLSANPLPASLEVWLTDYTQVESFADEFRGRPEVEEVWPPTVDYAGWVATLRRLTHQNEGGS